MPPRKTRAGTQPKLTQPTPEQIIYLAGLFDATLTLKNTATGGAIAISDTKEWPQYMAKTFGGNARGFESQKGKRFVGWFVPIRQRLELVKMLEGAGHVHSLDSNGFLKVITKLERAINSGHGDEGGGPTENLDDDDK